MKHVNRRAIVAEFLGTAFLVAAVVGSGIMGERLSNGNFAIALLANSIATGAILVVLIATFGPLSGAHFNPVVTVAVTYRQQRNAQGVWGYVGAQLGGALAGVMIANVMFGLPPTALSHHARGGLAQVFGEAVATFGLLLVILVCSKLRESSIPFAVAGYITAAYWFTSSTSFANPVVTIARALTDTFSGIRPIDVPAFVLGQVCGGVAAVLVSQWMTRQPAALVKRGSA